MEKKYLIPKIIIIPSLILTYFTGPIGLVTYWFLHRIFFAKKLALMIKPFDFYFDFVSPYSFYKLFWGQDRLEYALLESLK